MDFYTLKSRFKKLYCDRNIALRGLVFLALVCVLCFCRLLGGAGHGQSRVSLDMFLNTTGREQINRKLITRCLGCLTRALLQNLKHSWENCKRNYNPNYTFSVLLQMISIIAKKMKKEIRLLGNFFNIPDSIHLNI